MAHETVPPPSLDIEAANEIERLRVALVGLLEAWDFMHGGVPTVYDGINIKVVAARKALSVSDP